jgi:hypothetical protein
MRRAASLLAAVLSAAVLAACTSASTGTSTKIAVLGDSYSSGEGSSNWISPTGSGDYSTGAPGTCHRSSQAYAVIVLHANLFVACSGATSDDIQMSYRGDPSQVAQLRAIGSQVKTVVLSAGGDDAGFAGVLADCTSYVGSAHIHATLHQDSACGTTINDSEQGLNGKRGLYSD